ADAPAVEQLGGEAVRLTDQAKQQVLRLDKLSAGGPRFFARQRHCPSCPLRELAGAHHPFLSSAHPCTPDPMRIKYTRNAHYATGARRPSHPLPSPQALHTAHHGSRRCPSRPTTPSTTPRISARAVDRRPQSSARAVVAATDRVKAGSRRNAS